MASGAMVTVSVHNTAGEKLALELDSGKDVRCLKEELASRWCIPCRCQTLLLGTSLLCDADSIAKCASGEVSLVVSVEEVIQDLDMADIEKDAAKRQEALATLAKLGPRAEGKAFEAILPCLAHQEAKVRGAALDAIAEISTNGDEKSLSVATPLLHDDDFVVRLKALEALARIVSKVEEDTVRKGSGTGIDEAITAVIEHLKLSDETVRLSALKALSQMVKNGDPKFVAQVVILLEDREALVRSTAVAAMAALANKSHVDAVRAIVARFGYEGDEPDGVRSAAIQALVELKGDCKGPVLTALEACLQDERETVRFSAVQAMAKLALQGDRDAIAALASSAEHEDDLVKMTAFDAICELSEAGDEIALQALSK
eukprot:TRINITY_DN9378_c2_g1_i1.p1 TRINITY_DN9378_c2_g1~~TRINITY_DN9378_c2_g1_i1.p1  ORF type:complete len:394 (+),score=100.94 TRINITY_DN9378_c2_g1_i1:64-1182(+)